MMMLYYNTNKSGHKILNKDNVHFQWKKKKKKSVHFNIWEHEHMVSKGNLKKEKAEYFLSLGIWAKNSDLYLY